MTEPKNLTLILLREMRTDIDRGFDEMNARFDAMDERLDGMQANGIKALKSFIGHRALVERAFGSYDSQPKGVQARVDAPEARP